MLSQECRNPSPNFSNPTSSTVSVNSNNQSGSAKAYLHLLCTAKHWKQPLFECCNEEGPPHIKLFTFKVSILSEVGFVILESYSHARSTKKAAAEDAAEGALWCLKHMTI
ncbi:ribonuclease 3-like protein 1 isoform X2 [Salvia splendens]|uniref:ribonuclease 3-like protein 1 isoform X2 n=1 Tax=Salvia splendens TaxID=180675 RepID=UPI001C253122|nr:ribonuclease 3-like protein 1 isoform X2 [Salvia splendens]